MRKITKSIEIDKETFTPLLCFYLNGKAFKKIPIELTKKKYSPEEAMQILICNCCLDEPLTEEEINFLIGG